MEMRFRFSSTLVSATSSGATTTQPIDQGPISHNGARIESEEGGFDFIIPVWFDCLWVEGIITGSDLPPLAISSLSLSLFISSAPEDREMVVPFLNMAAN